MSTLRLDQLYTPSSSEKVVELERDLSRELAELTSELEENEMQRGIAPKITGTVPPPKEIEHFRLERALVIQRALQVSEAQPLRSQAEEMRIEMAIAENLEYSKKSLPLLLNQYFLERIQNLIQSKHLHMLRWRRFCEHTSTIESMHPLYNERLTLLMNEYHDCVQRAYRLSSVKEKHMAGKDEVNVTAVTMEDLLIYLRWLVCHLHAMKHFNQYLKVLQWLPVTHKQQMAPPDEQTEMEDVSNASKIASRYQDESTYTHPDTSSRPSSALSGKRSASPIPQPPPINLALLNTTPLPSSSMIYAAAATGGGLASNEATLCLPLHATDLDCFRPQLTFFLNLYGVNYDLNSIQNKADEMELFAAVNRKYKHFFIKQEHLLTFRRYDFFESGSEGWGSDSPNHALLKDSIWLPFVNLTAQHDPLQEKRWTELRHLDKVDEILRVMAHFLKVKDADKVQETLKEHALLIHHPPPVQAASVTSHKTPHNTRETWRKIYSNPDLYTNTEMEENAGFQDIDERDADTVNLTAGSRTSRRRKESYDYVNTVQMLGLDDGEQNSGDPVTVQGSLLSFLHLRHLRIRDLQRTCLGVMNYFRSIERTLTINDGGLSLEGDSAKRTSPQNHRVNTETQGTVGGGGGLGSHAYLHNTPLDFKISESEFMEYGDVENHDDFYTIDEGRVHVQDQRGYYVMYTSSVADFQAIEKDLLLMATHFIEKDRDYRSTGRFRGSDSSRRSRTDAGDFDIPSYAHQDVDRFGILLDIWTNETAFQERKRELLDCYYEAYQHVTDRDEKRALAETITQVMHRRPRMDFDAPYFIRAYRTECTILQQEAALVKSILDKQIEEQRVYTQRVCREGEAHFGLPTRVIPKQPISVNLSRPALKNVYMLEFHPTLAIASRIPKALKYANWEIQQMHKPETVQDSLNLEKRLLEVAHKEWNTMPHIGTSFSPQLDKDLFSDIYVEDPLFMCELAQHLVNQQEQQSGARRSHKDRQLGMLEAVGRVMETVTLRHRLIEAAWESEILSDVYVAQAKEMGYDAAHLNMRLVQFEYTSHRPAASKPPPIFITAIQDNDSSVDKYSPSQRNLAIHELDESHVGRFSFRTREGVLQVLRPGGMESLQVVLKVQIVHKSALASAVLQASICHPVRDIGKGGRSSPSETKSEKSSMTQLTGMSGTTVPTSLGGHHQAASKLRLAPEAFMSLQLEKTPSRDLMLNDFVSKKQTMGSVLKNPDELEKLKRKFISEFCERFYIRMAHTSMRAQILAYYNSILSLLEDFPSIKDTYFMEGMVNEKKDPKEDDLPGLTPDPRQLKKRPRRLLSQDGRHVLNLWFIPHHTEVLIMFKHLDDDFCYRGLAFTLSIVSSLHDMLQYLCAFSRLGSSHARLGSRRMEFVSADWGGAEGIGSELREIQKHIDALSDPTDPNMVQELLWLRRDVLFLEFDTAVRHCMTDTFLSTGNMQAFRSVSSDMRSALPALSNIQRPSLFAAYLTVPEPMEPRDGQARTIVPWRSFLGMNGPFPCMFWQWTEISYNIQLCLAGLREVDRHVANGEILGVTLLMEDVLQMGYQGARIYSDSKDISQSTSRAESRSSHIACGATPDLKDAAKALSNLNLRGLQRSQQPLEAYRLLKFFLLLWKCLELLKTDWGCRRLSVEAIASNTVYREFAKTYRVEILVPVLQSVARRLGQGEMYDAISPETDVLVMPKGASEIEVRAKQLTRLLEALELHMIGEVRKRVAKELTLALAERAREETALPTDLWKRAVMKESFTTNRPHVAEHFVDNLMTQAEETDTHVTFTREHLRSCLGALGREVMMREKQNYESYTMYYENMLRSHHQLLYKTEQEVKHLRDELKQAKLATSVEVQCEMASRAYDLIMEITALRAKILEMREQAMTAEQDVRESVKKEFKEVIQSMFGANSQLRSRFDEFREQLNDDVCEKIAETRSVAVAAMTRLSEKFGGSQDDDLRVNLARAEQLRQLQHENHQLNTVIIKMKAMHAWRRNHLTNNFLKTIVDLRKDGETGKKEMVEIKMLAEEQVMLLRQQLVAIKRALASTESESNEVRRALDKELRVKQEKEHELMQKERNKLQLEAAKQASIERLVEELGDKEQRLKQLTEEQDRSSKIQSLTQEKVRKDIDTIRKQLTHERSLKLDAFHRVDELQSQVYDYESSVFGHPQFGASTISVPPTPSLISRSRATSAGQTRRTARPITSTGVWPPPTSWPANRVVAPSDDGDTMNNLDYKKIQRPKTVGGRLRSRIAEQLLNELEPDHHRTIVQLEQLQLEGRRNITT
ncbi:uncharacterized protein LOC143299362 isoform X2 [Babylonia areolata]|uniref:uncharacterized protein LOC143299362 isoform X2 n=1 Tax=Babylonia areolata TaxID=304850 RepID=UPI003FD2D27D